MHHFDVMSIVSGAAGYSAMAYAAQSFPEPKNAYGRWLLGVVQYVLSNAEKGRAAFNKVPQQDTPQQDTPQQDTPKANSAAA